MHYTNKQMIENYLKRSLTEDEEAFLVLIIPAVEQYIDTKCGTTFKQVDPSTRYYDSDGGTYIDIDPAYDITSVGSVNSDGTPNYSYTLDTEYVIGPLNSYSKNEIFRRSGHFPTGNGVMAVTGRFSSWDGGVPADIKVVATKLAAGLLGTDQADTDGTVIASEAIEGHSITYDTSVDTFDRIATEDKFVKAILSQRSGVLIG